MNLSGKGHKEFLNLLNRYKSGDATPEEEEFVDKYFRYIESQPGIMDQLTDTEKDFIETEIRERLMKSIGEKPETPVYDMTRRIQWKRIAVAAILVTIAGTAGYFILNTNPPSQLATNNVKTIENDLLPGKDKAILTLADGRTILLDSAGIGKLASQGNTEIVKLENNTVAYNTGKGAAGGISNNTMSTPKGGKYTVVLPDGSIVWLNAASSITYPTAFTGNDRTVTATGEIYFEIKKDAKRPFRVQLPDESQVQVLGTHFNINSYGDEGDVKTTLLEGSVKVSAGNRTVILTPGQQAQTTPAANTGKKAQSISVKNDADLEQVMAWRNGYFHFNRTPFKTVMQHIARWYDVEVIYEGKIPTDKFIGELPMDANASEVLKVLEKMQVKFKIEGKKIIVKS